MSGTKHIQKLVGKMQVLKFHTPVCENVKYLINDFELDVISISKSGMLYEFEVKISRGDFKADLKKRKHLFYSQLPERGPNYLSYVCPTGLIKASEIGSAIGLYYVENDEIQEVRAPKRLHKTVHNRVKILEKICRVNSERQFLGACRMTFENKEHIAKTAKYFKPVISGPDEPAENKKSIIMDNKIEYISKTCHEANKVWCQANGDDTQKHWSEAEQWQRDSAISGVKFKLDNPSAGHDAQHNAWMDDKVKDGWVYGEVKDAEKKTHPCIIPFEQLPEFQKKKDALFCAIVDALK